MIRIQLLAIPILIGFLFLWLPAENSGQEIKKNQPKQKDRFKKASTTETQAPTGEFTKFGIYANSAPRAAIANPVATDLPLKLEKGAKIVFIGNSLLERVQDHGWMEAMFQKRFSELGLKFRNLAWSGDEVDNRPRAANFADVEQHLTHEKADVIFAAYGFNESFAGMKGLEEFKKNLEIHLDSISSKAFNGKTAPQIILISPTANANLKGCNAGDLNNKNLETYTHAMREVARKKHIAFIDVFESTKDRFSSNPSKYTFNGCHLTSDGHKFFAELIFNEIVQETPPNVDDTLRKAIIDKDKQFFRRYRPLNTFYYVGGRNKDYGYLDFLPAMQNFDIMVSNRDNRIHNLAMGKKVPIKVDDSNVPVLPETAQTRGVNEWLPAEKELQAFKVDPRFEVNLFAGEEQFPEIANPIQMRWDSRGRLWVSCSNTYPHVYPGNEPNDKIVILEDTNGDGKADKSTIFAQDLHIPLSFEFGNGGVYVSEQPHLTFLKDTNGDDKADIHQIVLSGFGTEDSHHALHDFTWTPDGDLLFRESIFHHSQVETPYGPVRQQNSGWFRYEPDTFKLTSFGSYPSTNPWGVTFDDWGQHVASHPIYAAAFHAIDPPYPQQHPNPKGLRAYSGTCGQEFVDFKTFPTELQGCFIKVRYKPTNRVEIHKWVEGPFGFDEEYVSDLIFSTNLSFIPVDIQFGPRGDLYVCDWYNPVKGHAQYSLRDKRRDRHSGRIWRITPKNFKPQEAPDFSKMAIKDLVRTLESSHYRYRYWVKRELRERDRLEVLKELDIWVNSLRKEEPRYRHHQMEAVWAYRWVRGFNEKLLTEILSCEDHHARAAATQQLRYWHSQIRNSTSLLRNSANDSNGIVRMEAAIAASYIGTKESLEAMLDVFKHPRDGHLEYAIISSLGSKTLRPFWEGNTKLDVNSLMRKFNSKDEIREPAPTTKDLAFDKQPSLKTVNISCLHERMLFSLSQFVVQPGQPVKLIFTNSDATDHNLVFVKPNSLAEVGMAGNEMAKDPRNANSDFIPPQKKHLILHASPMIGPTRESRIHVFRFNAPMEPGIYPYVCTFPGHWIIMKGDMVVAPNQEEAEKILKSLKPALVNEWKMTDFDDLVTSKDENSLLRGMQAFMKANCHQCHAVAGKGVNLGPDLCNVFERYKGKKLLQQILEPSSEINPKYLNHRLYLNDGRTITGVIDKEANNEYHVITNLLTPTSITKIPKKQVEEKTVSKISPMPVGMINTLTKPEITDLISFLEAGYKFPDHLNHPKSESKK